VGRWLCGRRVEPRQGRPKRIKARGVGISVAFDDATDCRRHCGKLVVGEVNCRHGPDIIGRYLSSKERGTCLTTARMGGVYSSGPLMTDSLSAAHRPIDKLDAARRQIECAIRLVAAEEDELAIHTLVMAAYGILEDLSKGRPYYEIGFKPWLTKIGLKRFRATANFLKHADRDPHAVHTPEDLALTDSRVGCCIILYRDLRDVYANNGRVSQLDGHSPPG
jgi:hypothetical protein